MTADAIAKVGMLKGSVRCLVFGVLGLSPVLGLPITLLAMSTGFVPFGLVGLLSLVGLPFALVALSLGNKVWWQEKQYGDAGKLFRIWGMICAAVGAVMWVVVAFLLAYSIANGWPNYWSN